MVSAGTRPSEMTRTGAHGSFGDSRAARLLLNLEAELDRFADRLPRTGARREQVGIIHVRRLIADRHLRETPAATYLRLS